MFKKWYMDMKLIKRQLIIENSTTIDFGARSKYEIAQFKYVIGDVAWKGYKVTLKVTKRYSSPLFYRADIIIEPYLLDVPQNTMTHDEMYHYLRQTISYPYLPLKLDKHNSIYTYLNERYLNQRGKEMAKLIAQTLDKYVKNDIVMLQVVLDMV